MTMTLGLIGVAVLAVVGFVAYRITKNAKTEAPQEVMRVTRKNRAKQPQETAES